MSAFRTVLDDDAEPAYGYDWAMAPVLPIEAEYRQKYAAAQLQWLETWQPKTAH